MFFTAVGRVLASLMVFFGASRFGFGFYAAYTEDQAFAARYVGSASPGEAIDRGLLMLAAGIAFGVLTDISRSLRR